jgi:magnesium chelatase subunit H
MPLEQLGRPRVDVVITLSGIFRDLLPLQIKLLAEAAFLAASADEPDDLNFVRKHALAYQAEHGGDLETASLRVFGNAEGAYGSNVNHLVDNSRWDDEDELAETYTRRKGFAYGRSGRPVQQAALLTSVLAGVDLAYQNLDSVELGVTTVDTYFDTLGGISRAVKRAKGGDAQVAPVYIGDQTRGDGRCARCPSRWRWRPAPACSIRSGTRACWSTATRACARSRCTSPTPWAGRPPPARFSPGSTSSSPRPSCSTRPCASAWPN